MMSKYIYRLLVTIFVLSLAMLLFGVLCWAMPIMMHPWYSRHLLIRVGIPGLIVLATLREMLLTTHLLNRFKPSHDTVTQSRLHTASSDLGIDFKVIRLVDHPLSIAFCAGIFNPIVIISTGLVERLSPKQLNAVLLHEHYHYLRRDPLRILVLDVMRVALFFLPAIHEWRDAFKAKMEVAADQYAVQRIGKPALAGALHCLLAEEGNPPVVAGAAAGLSINALRVASLLGDPYLPLRISSKSLIISIVILWALCLFMI
jgi:beta-lactamase regulating signal transducer with metallopeptidase domain